MAVRALFESTTEDVIRESLRAARHSARSQLRDKYDLAIDYLEGRQVDDVEQELSQRYEQTQAGKRGQDIKAIALPITSKFVDEQATLYSRPVARKIVNEDGTSDDKTTEELTRFLGDSGYDEHMEAFERRLVLLKSLGNWFQSRNGLLHPVTSLPQDTYPVRPMADEVSEQGFDATNQDDYAAFVVETARADDHTNDAQRSFSWLSRADRIDYESSGPFEDASDATKHGNPFKWPQFVENESGTGGGMQTLPLQMLAIWHQHKPSGELIIDTDVTIADTNRELNLQISLILDTLAHQGWAIPVLRSANPESSPSMTAAGPRFAITIDASQEETLELLSSAQSFAELMGVLESVLKIVALLENLSPNEFALTGIAPASGFAKLIDNLPKIEARQKLARRMARREAVLGWPRIASIGKAFDHFTPSLEQLQKKRLVVSYEDIKFPLTVEERIKEDEHNIKHGFKSRAEILAAKRDISVEQAEEIINENLGKQPDATEDDESNKPKPGNALSRLIGARR